MSVVVASAAGGEFLFRCLASLAGQVERAGAELLVVDRAGPTVRERIARDFPAVRVIPASPNAATVPAMRAAGALHARGDIVAVLEEHCTAPEGWLATIGAQFTEDDAAIGGPILDSAFPRVRDWVVYFSEYHDYLPPWRDGDHYPLNGANIAYDRRRLLRHAEVLADGYWEVVLHPRLARDGRFRAVNAMGAHHTGPFTYGYYLRQRYLLSRSWGGARRHDVSSATRWTYMMLAPLLPLLLFTRATRNVMPRRAMLRRFVPALPLLVPVWLAYAWGEWLGYAIGPGRALELVE